MVSMRDDQAGCVWHDEATGPACGQRDCGLNLCRAHLQETIRRNGGYPYGIEQGCTPCATCGRVTAKLETARCDYCWEVETRMATYLQRGGENARKFVLSCLGAIALCLALPGCGGAPFAFPRDAGADAEPDAGAIGDPAPDAGDILDGQPDAQVNSPVDPSDAGADAGLSLADASPDAIDGAAVCTTPLQTTPRDLCPGETANRVFPATFIRSAAPGDCADIAGFFTTPPACACVETFTCACLLANGVGPSCAMVGGVPWIY